MLFKKLFKVLVVGGTMLGAGTTAGCAARAAEGKKPAADAGTATAAPDAGAKKEEGGGAPGW